MKDLKEKTIEVIKKELDAEFINEDVIDSLTRLLELLLQNEEKK